MDDVAAGEFGGHQRPPHRATTRVAPTMDDVAAGEFGGQQQAYSM